MTACPAETLFGPFNAVERKHAPALLYVQGHEDIVASGARVAIVGSREATPFGLARARRLAHQLVARGVVVVSGLAKGIDTAAHITAIEQGGRTIAVLGTPLTQSYPRENAALQQRIGTDHLLLISQFAAGVPVQRRNFPLRNRTMALISDATVIIEASNTSGALSQGWEALRLGRLLYITQAVVRDPALTWPKDMLAAGAKVLSNETLEAFIEGLPPRVPKSRSLALTF
jgi:DNA processing protein